jgi:phage shock protein A
VRQAYAEAIAGQRRLQRQKDQADAVASDWYNKAQLALRRGNEGLAREALARRQLELDKAGTLQRQMDTQGGAIDKLYTAMNALDVKIREAASKQQQLVARARTAKSTAQVNDMLSGLTGKTSMDAFVRMEQKVEALEAAAEVSAEMSLLPGSIGSKDSLDMEFRLLEQSSKVDEELEKLKGNLNETKMLRAGGTEEKIRERVSIPIRERVSIPAGRGETIEYW